MALKKKGSIDDLVYIVGAVLFVAMLFLIGGKFLDEFNTHVAGSDKLEARGKTAVGQINGLYDGVMDNAFLFLTIGLCIAALIMAMMVVIHPVFFVFYFIILAVVIFVGGVASNVYQAAASQPELASIADKLIFTSHILQYLPFIIGTFGFVLAIIMYKTWQQNA